MRKIPTLMSVLACSLAMSGAAIAVPLQPGQVVNLSGTTALAEPWLVGGNVDSGNVIPFTVLDNGGNAVFQGVFTSEPGLSDIMGTIRVRYRVRDLTAVGARRVARVDILGFSGLQTNVTYRTDGVGSVGPNLASRTNAPGAQISFLYSDPVFPPDVDSRFLNVHTNATSFSEQGVARIVLNTGESAIVGGVHIPALSDCPGDTNGDGVVNFTDLNTVLSEFGENCP